MRVRPRQDGAGSGRAHGIRQAPSSPWRRPKRRPSARATRLRPDFPSHSCGWMRALQEIRCRIDRPWGHRRRGIRRVGRGDGGWLRRRTCHVRPARAADLRALRCPDPSALVTLLIERRDRRALIRGHQTRTRQPRGRRWLCLAPARSHRLHSQAPRTSGATAPPTHEVLGELALRLGTLLEHALALDVHRARVGRARGSPPRSGFRRGPSPEGPCR